MSESLVTFQTSQGAEMRGSVHTIARNQVIFEMYAPEPVLRMSELLSRFTLFAGQQPVYSGKGLVSNLIQTGGCTVCQVQLEDAWIDGAVQACGSQPEEVRASFRQFLNEWGGSYRILPEFKAAIADIHSFLVDLRNWLDQVELSIRSSPTNNRQEMERRWIESLAPQTTAAIGELFDKFEGIARRVEPSQVPAHTVFGRRHLHPLILAAPFVYRTLQKPLGYAGDYEMVNMMLRDPCEGGSLFAKAFNVCALSRPPIVAHRNRLVVLTERLVRETLPHVGSGRRLRVLNVGCGPAHEIKTFLREHACSSQVDFTLIDFNAETLEYTSRNMAEAKSRHGRATRFEFLKRSVQSLLKQGGKQSESPGQYDFVYCAGLFDYLPDMVCRNLVAYFYTLLAPGGLVLVTNVDEHPSRKEMEYFLDWHLIYRDCRALHSLAPPRLDPDQVFVQHETSGINVFLEIRKPGP